MKKGFTLIELLAVIVILGVVSVIIAGIIVGYIDGTKMNAYEVGAKNVIDAAKEYSIPKTCANSACGYKSCRTAACGVAAYNSCATGSCGCAYYNSCNVIDDNYRIYNCDQVGNNNTAGMLLGTTCYFWLVEKVNATSYEML